MKKIIIALWLTLSASIVYASCTTTTVFQGGKATTCTTCCFNGNCTVNCI